MPVTNRILKIKLFFFSFFFKKKLNKRIKILKDWNLQQIFENFKFKYKHLYNKFEYSIEIKSFIFSNIKILFYFMILKITNFCFI